MSIDIKQLLDSADLMVATQNYDNAIELYNQAIEADVNCDEAYLLRGELYGKLGQTEKAFNDVLKAISIDPDYDVAHLVLALLYKTQGDTERSIEACLQAVKLNKDNKEAIYHITQSYETLADKQLAEHQSDAAVDNYHHALNYVADNINLLYKLAFATSRTGDFDKAISLAEQILERDGKHVPTKSLLVAIYEKKGLIEKGWKIIDSLVQEYPDNPFINITFGKYALRNNQQTIAISKLLNTLKQPGLKIDDQLSMHMLLGKLYDSISDYKNAFTQFSQANNLKYNDYKIETFEEQVSGLINYFSKEKYSELPSSSVYSDKSIFILGMPRSGTSLIEQIVSSHSKVYGGGELQNVPALAQSMQAEATGAHYPQQLDHISSDALDGYANGLLESMRALSPESQKITDKLPHNFLFIGLIHKLLPNAKIINCLRNPVDTCLSCYFQHFGGYHPYAYDLDNLSKYYQQYMKLMHHWEVELQIPVLNIQYENLVRDTREEVDLILDYLGLSWEDRCLEFHNQNRAINTSSYTQVNKKIYTDSIGRWVNYKIYISELLNVLGVDS